MHRFGGEPVGAFRNKQVKPAPWAVAHALFYDQTHDNPAAAEKRTLYDYLPTAGMVSMAYCASASSRGYDEFVPFHVSDCNFFFPPVFCAHACFLTLPFPCRSTWSRRSGSTANGPKWRVGSP